MKKTVFSSLLLSTSVIVSCTSPQHMTTGGPVPGASIDSGGKVLLLAVPDGVEKEDGPAAGTGQQMYSAIRDALIMHGIPIATASTADLASGLDEATRLGCAYVLKSTIPEWEDNATEWSARPDVGALSVELYSSSDRTLVASATHRVQSGSAQMFSRKPERFIPELVDQSLAVVFGWQPTITTPK